MVEFNYQYILDELKRREDERAEKYAALQERVHERALTANQGLEPVVAIDGRLHAPCDGYKWWDSAHGVECVYAGGQYLPVSDCLIDSNPSVNKRIPVPEVIYQQMEASGKFLDGYRFAGKAWIDKVSRVENRYLYFFGEGWYLDTLQKIIYKVWDNASPEELGRLPEEVKPPKGEAPVGHSVVVGTVMKIKCQEGMYGSQLKMLMELENLATVWGTAPSKMWKLLDDADPRGHKFQFEADFSKAEGDGTHSFFSSPKQVKLIA